MNLNDTTVFITGATSGFGAAAARRFVKEGARVVATGRREERLNTLRDELGAERFLPIVMDVREMASIEKAVESLSGDFSRVDVLVNNAGLAQGLEPAQEAHLEDWETMIDTNIKGLVYCTRQLLPGMVERERGHVVNIGSVAGTYPYPGGNVYGATKAFVEQFSMNLRADLSGKNVRVTNIAPGMAETEFSLVRFKGDAERASQPYSKTKPMSADDIAEAIFWAVSLPEHLNINKIEMMPTIQSFSPFTVYREG